MIRNRFAIFAAVTTAAAILTVSAPDEGAPPPAPAAVAAEIEPGTILLRSDFDTGYAGWHVAGDANTVWVANGELVLGLDRDSNGVLHEGRIHTDLNFTYGTFRARIRFAGPVGGHASLWAQSVSKNGTAYYPGASEIDVVESFRSDRPNAWHTIWYADSTGALVKSQDSTSVDVTQPHNYLVQWKPDGYTFKVDGVTSFTTSAGKSGVPHYGILSYLVADWEEKNLADKLGPYRAFVDFAEFKANEWTTVP